MALTIDNASGNLADEGVTFVTQFQDRYAILHEVYRGSCLKYAIEVCDLYDSHGSRPDTYAQVVAIVPTLRSGEEARACIYSVGKYTKPISLL